MDLPIVNLKDKCETIVSNEEVTFSGGEKKKVFIIRTLLKDVDMLIMDEPECSLDKKSIQTLYNILLKQVNKIIIIISHSDIFDEIADEIINIT